MDFSVASLTKEEEEKLKKIEEEMNIVLVAYEQKNEKENIANR